MLGLALAAAAAGVGLARPAATRADGSDPTFPASRLSLDVTGPTQAGQILTIHATGANGSRTGASSVRYGLELIVTDPSLLPGNCLPTESAELTRISTVSGGGSLLTYSDLDEGTSGRFAIREPYEPLGSGPLQVCAYTKWRDQDAAWAQLDVTIVPAPTAAPRSLARPVVRRSGGMLECSRGRWTHSPAAFAYRWRIGTGREGAIRSGARWAIPRKAQGRSVRCTVIASNVKGAGHATSRPFRIRPGGAHRG